MNHELQCLVCQYGPSGIDWGASNCAIGAQVGCSEASVRRHRKWADALGIGPGDEVDVAVSEPDGGTWRPRRKWQSASGEVMYSWENVAQETPAEVHLDNERIDLLIRDWPTVPATGLLGAAEFAFPADLQLGKSEGGSGTDDTIRKFKESIERVAERWAVKRPNEGYLCDMGDLVENLYSTRGQVSTNDRTLPEQLEDAVALYMNAIGRLRPLCGVLTFATVTSNHGEARNDQKNNPYDSENDWGLYIQRIIQSRCEDRGWHVEFARPEKYHDTTVVTTKDGSVVALTHGHHSGTPARMKEWVKNQIVGNMPGKDATLWVHGHYHHQSSDTLGDDITIFGTPSLDPGSAWFTKKSGDRARQGIVALTVAGGKWFDYSIL